MEISARQQTSAPPSPASLSLLPVTGRRAPEPAGGGDAACDPVLRQHDSGHVVTSISSSTPPGASLGSCSRLSPLVLSLIPSSLSPSYPFIDVSLFTPPSCPMQPLPLPSFLLGPDLHSSPIRGPLLTSSAQQHQPGPSVGRVLTRVDVAASFARD